jgi:acetoacetyl-CoA synthetase
MIGHGGGVFVASRSEGQSVEHLKIPGELVCIQPFPSQPLQFYGDANGKRYCSSYSERFGLNTWHQGDFMEINIETGGIVMLGRSKFLYCRLVTNS